MNSDHPVAVVTGAGGGIGRASAVALARRGFAIAALGRTSSTLDGTAAAIGEVGGQSLTIVADVGNEADVEAAFEESRGALGPCEVLINAAAIHGKPMPLTEVTLAQWEEVVRSNLTTTFLCSRAALHQMIPRGRGSIVFIASAGINRGFPGATPYSAAKSALIGLSHTLGAEIGPLGIRVNVLSPGAVPTTNLYQSAVSVVAAQQGVTVEDLNQATIEMSALRRLCDAEEIARSVVFLATDDSSPVTAQHLVADAGLTL